MNQEKIGNTIKSIRKKYNLTQEQFAEKYGVTYQAVSKWENGKNIPDILILKEICNDYNININELLEVNNTKKSNKFKRKKIIILILIVIFIITLSKNLLNDNSFVFKTLKAQCNNFNLYGSIAYNTNKTSIYISNITYCGKKDTAKYKEIECTLYEQLNNTKTKIDSYNYNEKEITLDEFLKKVTFKVEHYSKTCKMYKKNVLNLEIEATKNNGETILYKIPLKLEKNCID